MRCQRRRFTLSVSQTAGLTAAAVLAGAFAAAAAPGDLDLTFRGTGWMRMTPSTGVAGMAVQPDGKIVLTGSLPVFGHPVLTVWRLLPDGSPDASFNNTGVVQLTEAGTYGGAVLLRSEGRILIPGSRRTTSADFPEFLLASFLPDGRRDSTFGISGNGLLSTPNNGFVTPVILQPDGKILSSGAQTSPVLVRRWLPNGTPDPDFGSTGAISVPLIGDHAAGVLALAVQGDGRILLARDDAACEITRLLPDGSLDVSFGGGTGTSSLSAAGERGQWYALTVLPDGKILGAGEFSPRSGGDRGFILARYLSGGSLDLSFGDPATPGRVLLPVDQTYFSFAALVLQAGGILVAGSTGSPLDIVVARFTYEGRPDSSVGNAGRVRTNLGATEFARAAALVTNDKLLVAGSFGSAAGQENLLVAYQVHGSVALAVEYPVDHVLPLQSGAPVDFGPVTVPTQFVQFTLRNTGLLPIADLRAVLTDESIPGEYHIEPPVATSLSPGDHTTVLVSLTPTAAPGLRTATLRLTAGNSSPSLLPRTILLTGSRATARQIWRVTWFGSPDNSGAGADENDFDGDGLPNFMEYALHSHPHTYTFDPCRPDGPGSLSYTRPAAALTEFLYVPEYASSPGGPWFTGGLASTVLTDDGAVQNVRIALPVQAPGSRLFLRLKVSKL